MKDQTEETKSGFVERKSEDVFHKSSGSVSNEFNSLVALQALRGSIPKHILDNPDEKIEFEGVLTALENGVKPRDELEGLLAAQMVSGHHLAMDFLRLALNSERVDHGERFVNSAVKLMRTFTSQIEALTRYRARGQQKVVVEHVTVNQGGQAIVGVVTNLPGGGGHE